MFSGMIFMPCLPFLQFFPGFVSAIFSRRGESPVLDHPDARERERHPSARGLHPGERPRKPTAFGDGEDVEEEGRAAALCLGR